MNSKSGYYKYVPQKKMRQSHTEKSVAHPRREGLRKIIFGVESIPYSNKNARKIRQGAPACSENRLGAPEMQFQLGRKSVTNDGNPQSVSLLVHVQTIWAKQFLFQASVFFAHKWGDVDEMNTRILLAVG